MYFERREAGLSSPRRWKMLEAPLVCTQTSGSNAIKLDVFAGDLEPPIEAGGLLLPTPSRWK